MVDAFGALPPEGEYLPLLLSVEPRLVVPGKDGDYFSSLLTLDESLAAADDCARLPALRARARSARSARAVTREAEPRSAPYAHPSASGIRKVPPGARTWRNRAGVREPLYAR